MSQNKILPYHSINELQEFLSNNPYSSLFFIVDHKVAALHSDYLAGLSVDCPIFSFIIKGSEVSKSIESVNTIWKELLKNNIHKNALIVNLGGGTICDIGGFVAATYKRGIHFINIPTTLLAMIDAAIGGKNGINVNHIKNAVGTIQLPQRVFKDVSFLTTLPHLELMSGFGELIKYALIGNVSLWNELQDIPQININSLEFEWISNAANYKNQIVEEDLYDEGKRHLLNFGHTIGHALESYYLTKKRKLSHGHAVALGICCESWISHLHQFISKEEAIAIRDFISRHYFIPRVPNEDFELIFNLVLNDKKNRADFINVSLLSAIGKGIPDQSTNEQEIKESLAFLFM